jgi:hypothetical protein
VLAVQSCHERDHRNNSPAIRQRFVWKVDSASRYAPRAFSGSGKGRRYASV